ncbi:MAG TPA: helix-turn-helix domain-containing protein [Nitrospira sp.]|nr:helix-turn-helix domain-containing protein [Nitrospira sp.]
MEEPTKIAGQKERRRNGRKELSRQDILDAAEHVFGLKGYHEASLQEIAERAEFSTSALYRFFDNKEALFLSISLLPVSRNRAPFSHARAIAAEK